MTKIKTCLHCGKSAEKPKKYSYKQWERFKFCSNSCQSQYNIPVRIKRGKEHYLWKGDKVSYRSLHHWVERNFGTPTVCEFCNKSNLTSRSINWANKTGKYLRKRSDWLRLCKSCHTKYDNGKRKKEGKPKRK